MPWTVGERGTVTPKIPTRKVPYTSKYRIKEDTPADQRKTMELINLMIDVLKENGLMEDNKKEKEGA